jgi:hypothetical protein
MTKESNQPPLEIPELGTSVYFGKEPLRHEGSPNLQELWGIARKYNVGLSRVIKVIARQLHIYKHPFAPDRTYTKALDLKGLTEDIPFCVAQTSIAAFKHGTSINVNPYNFIKNHSTYVPTAEELTENNFTSEDLRQCMDGSAKLAGSVTISYFDSWDGDDRTLLIPRGDHYSGKMTIPGGHSDGPLDVAGLSEGIEEAKLDPDLVRRADPLGSFTQVVFTTSEGVKRLEKYLNMVWQIQVYDPAELRRYESDSVYVDSETIREDQLTPIAKEVLKMTQYI